MLIALKHFPQDIFQLFVLRQHDLSFFFAFYFRLHFQQQLK